MNTELGGKGYTNWGRRALEMGLCKQMKMRDLREGAVLQDFGDDQGHVVRGRTGAIGGNAFQ